MDSRSRNWTVPSPVKCIEIMLGKKIVVLRKWTVSLDLVYLELGKSMVYADFCSALFASNTEHRKRPSAVT